MNLMDNVLFRQGSRLGMVLFLLFPLLSMSSCSSGKNTARVSGKVTAQGKEVTVGTVIFVPQTGLDEKNPVKSATGNVQTDGSFTLSTYSKGDGALVGRYRVNFSSPPPALPADKDHLESGEEMPKAPFLGYIPQPKEVEVKPGSNTFNIELVPPPPGK